MLALKSMATFTDLVRLGKESAQLVVRLGRDKCTQHMHTAVEVTFKRRSTQTQLNSTRFPRRPPLPPAEVPIRCVLVLPHSLLLSLALSLSYLLLGQYYTEADQVLVARSDVFQAAVREV